MRDENLAIDETIDYDVLPGMSHEVRQRLKDARPTTLVSLPAPDWSPSQFSSCRDADVAMF